MGSLRLAVLVIALTGCIALFPSNAAPNSATVRLTRIGSSEKVCQLTGDTDWETGRPTAARTFANFGLDACDLGYPVEHAGKLILLFGDSWPPRHGGGAAGEVPPDDAVGTTARVAPPNRDDGECLELEVHHTASPAEKFAPATVIGPTRVKQGFFNVPSGGVSVDGSLYAFFWTNHCSNPNPLAASPHNPLARPAVNPNRDCPETDDRNSLGRSVLARSDDEGRTFGNIAPMPTGFVYATAVNTKTIAGLPDDQRLGVLVFGVPRYRASVPYLAYAPLDSFADPATWRFFTGLSENGKPKWIGHDAWLHPTTAPNVPKPTSWSSPGEAELFRPSLEGDRCIGEMSVTWNRPLGMWLMLYNGAGGIQARVAPAPWGPWSLPTVILGGQDDVGCRLVMTPNGCGNRRDYWPGEHKNGKFVGGGFYAPFVLNRYTTSAGGVGDERRTSVYWLVSTWNPYQVTVMRTTLQAQRGSEGPADGSAFQVHPETTFQTMAGFGAGFNGDKYINAIRKPEDRDQAYDLLYGDKGVRLNVVRLTISPNAQPRRQVNAGGDRYDWANDENTQSVWKAIQPVLKKTKPIIYAVPFSPPVRWKDSGRLTNGGSLKHEYYRDYAEYLADFLEYYHKTLGVDVDVLSLQNEPGVAAPWQSCVWTGEELRDFLLILAPTVRARGLNTQFMLSEGTAWTGAWEHLKPTLDDTDARRFLNIMASHSYGSPDDKARGEFAAASRSNGLQVWMSEMSLMIPPQPDDPGMNAAIRIASYLHRDLVEGRASVWIYCFAIFTSDFQGSMGVLSPADGKGPQQGALVVPKRLWAMANYSHFVRPGFKLMQIDGDGADEARQGGTLANTGFISPEGDRFVIVALNSSANSRPVSYEFGDRTIGAIEAFSTTKDLNLAHLTPPAMQPHRFNATLPPMSVTTFVVSQFHL
jgi:O-glycosyl hydrolase